MPTYTQSEAIFSNKLSAYQTSIPDGVIIPKQECLKPGENVYGYVMGLTDSIRLGSPSSSMAQTETARATTSQTSARAAAFGPA